MPHQSFPEGRYFSATVDIHPDFGGQTRALLMRNRLFAQHAGVMPTLVTLGPAPNLDWRREQLLERGLTLPGMDLVNIYEHYAAGDWEGFEDPAGELQDLSAHVVADETQNGDVPWRRVHRLADQSTVHDFLRPDGTPFLRIPAFTFRNPLSWPTRLQRIRRDGSVAGSFGSIGEWYRRYLRDLAGGERGFFFLDSRYLPPHLTPFRDPKIFLLHTLHSIHVTQPRRWDSGTHEFYGRMMTKVGEYDAMVTLTHRQQDDLAQRLGRSNNLFVVPNPVDLPSEPEAVERDPNLVAVVARLAPEKRLEEAIDAMIKVRDRIPEARLEIYGAGERSEALAAYVAEKQVGGFVHLKGFDPHAREALWQASAFPLTSRVEGYPLASLESMSHGCPVVSYDIKYGPREQITDGVDGFLVPPKDVDALADRLARLLSDPALVARMSTAARATAAQHGPDRFIADWSAILRQVVEAKPARVALERVDLEVDRLQLGVKVPRRGFRLARAGGISGRVPGSDRLRFRGRLVVAAKPTAATLSAAQVFLDAVSLTTGEVVSLPLEHSVSKEPGASRKGKGKPRSPGELALRLDTTLGAALDQLPAPEAGQPEEIRLRLRLVWNNATWQTDLKRPITPAGTEANFDLDGSLSLLRRSPSAE